MKLVENWRMAARWVSVQAFAIIAMLPVIWPAIPADLKAYIPPQWGLYIFSIVALGGIVGRLIAQPGKE